MRSLGFLAFINNYKITDIACPNLEGDAPASGDGSRIVCASAKEDVTGAIWENRLKRNYKHTFEALTYVERNLATIGKLFQMLAHFASGMADSESFLLSKSAKELRSR